MKVGVGGLQIAESLEKTGALKSAKKSAKKMIYVPQSIFAIARIAYSEGARFLYQNQPGMDQQAGDAKVTMWTIHTQVS